MSTALWFSDVTVSFFFFSSRRRHTRCLSDWSSDVCSSDLARFATTKRALAATLLIGLLGTTLLPWAAGKFGAAVPADGWPPVSPRTQGARSEERRVGKEGRARGAAKQENKKSTRDQCTRRE